jgi:hypothetical protein
MPAHYLLYLRYQVMRPHQHFVSRGVSARYLDLPTVADFHIYRVDAETGIRIDMKKWFLMFQRIVRGRRHLLRRAFRLVRERELTGVCELSRLYAGLVNSGGESTI